METNLGNIPPILWDLKQAAAAISSTVCFLRTAIRDGKLPYVPLGRKFLIDPADLHNLVQARKRRAS